MKKMIIIISILCILTLGIGVFLITDMNITLFHAQPSSNQFHSIMPNEQVCYDLLITMLYPYVEKAISDYYSEYMTDLPREDPFFYRFTSIEKIHDLNYSYMVKLEVQPYVGPHLSVGRDRITFKIELNGVTAEKFEHIESHELPPNYQNIIKKKLPNT